MTYPPILTSVSQRPRASLGRVLDDLGDSMLELVAGDPDHEGDIGGVVIHDPEDEPVHPPGALVLGVGVPAADLAGLVRDLGRHGAVGLIVRAPVAVTTDLAGAVEEARRRAPRPASGRDLGPADRAAALAARRGRHRPRRT